ncbi:MAG: FKBP-type peptidyl-prolyl cis-trans isomerase [Chlamydiales bacterium]|nr:FKBP-type peptidyl-prolyl cis-trans isomerase [Chlamydiales bacterium]
MLVNLSKSCIVTVGLLFSTCFAQPIILSQEKYAVLNKFFQILIEESEVGYVLQGNKPVCIHGFFNKDPFSVSTTPHRHSVALREGSRIWQQLETSDPEVMLTIAKKEDPLIPNWIHIMAIHRTLFQNVLNKNLTIFQYVLGPTVSANSLLSAITSENATYHSLLKGDKVLIGEILGFGTQNALYVSRIENIEEAIEQVTPPFLNIQEIVREYPNEYLPFEPGFGFNSVKQELADLQKQVTFPSQKLISSNPEFVFGCLKNSEENNNFIVALEATQNQVQQQLQSQTFLEDILQNLTGHQYLIPTKSKKFSFCLNKPQLNLAAAKGIWESLQDYDQEYLSCFVSGMEDPNIDDCNIDRAAYFPNFTKELVDAKNNLIYANQLFKSFQQKTDLVCIIPNKLYYKIINNGQSSLECQGPLVSLEFSVFSPSGQCITHKSNLIVNLKNTIPGFALGVKGMKIGETREIFIHPSIGYGFDTSIDKCITLRAVVTLQNIHDNQSYSQAADPLNLDFVLCENTLNERIAKYKAALASKGKQVALHLKRCPQIDLHRVCNYLTDFQNNKNKFTPVSEEELILINQMHWNIYFSNGNVPES